MFEIFFKKTEKCKQFFVLEAAMIFEAFNVFKILVVAGKRRDNLS